MVRIDTMSSTNRCVTHTNNTLKAAAARTGVTVKVTPQDMRRGTAQEAAALNKATGIDSAAQVLGQTRRTQYTKVRFKIEHCSVETLWDTYRTLSFHEATHSSPDRKCSQPSCNSRTTLKDKPALVAHLMGVYQVACKDANTPVAKDTITLVVTFDHV